jgi:hypothetical protein
MIDIDQDKATTPTQPRISQSRNALWHENRSKVHRKTQEILALKKLLEKPAR